MSKDTELMVRHLALIGEDIKALLPLVASADDADRTVLRAASYDGGPGGQGTHADPTASAALSMKRERGNSHRREAREKVLEASRLLATARGLLVQASA